MIEHPPSPTPSPDEIVEQLFLAFEHHAGSRLEELAASGVGLETRDTLGRSVLHRAAAAESLRALEWILAAGADPAAADEQGSTPLHLAASNGSVLSCRSLLEAGAEVDRPDDRGRTPLAGAKTSDVVEILLGAGADPDRPDRRGESPRDRLGARTLIEPVPPLALWVEQPSIAIAQQLRTLGETAGTESGLDGVRLRRRPRAAWGELIPWGAAGTCFVLGRLSGVARRHRRRILRCTRRQSILVEPTGKTRKVDRRTVLSDGWSDAL